MFLNTKSALAARKFALFPKIHQSFFSTTFTRLQTDSSSGRGSKYPDRTEPPKGREPPKENEPPSKRNTNDETSSKKQRDRRNNIVRLIGPVGTDPVVKTGETSSADNKTKFKWAITSFSLPTNRYVKREKADTPENVADWHNIVQFKNNPQSLQKGDFIEVTGYIKYDKYKPSWAEKTVATTKIIAEEVKILKRKSEQSPKTENADESDDND